METIYALATPPGKSGVAIIRISGPQAKSALEALEIALPKPRMAQLAMLKHQKQTIDHALVFWFPAPHSFTGEDCVELHVHGSRAVIQALFSVLGTLPQFRMAAPGEFSRRAFENDKMDLTEAEGLADLIEAETKQQHTLAMRQMQGELHNLYESWRRQLIDSMAFIEAYVDFPDENLPKSLADDFRQKIEKLLLEMQHHLADNHRGQRLREGAKLVILGAPNAGKSSLLNYLAREELAIVSPIPGTTRDSLSAHLDISGYPVTLIDTAGIRNSEESVEKEGIRRALMNAEDADIILLLLDGETYPEIPAELHKYKDSSITVITKQDAKEHTENYLNISTKTGKNIDLLMNQIIEKLENLMRPSESPALTRTRHRQHVEQAVNSLQSLLSCIVTAPPEIHAEHLRQAAHATSALTGRIDLEDVLDHLFSQFCIGK